MEVESRPMVDIRSCRISSSRALRMESHIVLKVCGEPSQFVVGFNRHPVIVIALRHLRGRAVQPVHRLQNAAGEKISKRKPDRDGQQPDQPTFRCSSIENMARTGKGPDNVSTLPSASIDIFQPACST